MIKEIEIQDVIDIAKKAGKSIMKFYNEDFQVEYKDDFSPVTLADKKANQIIEAGLKKLPKKFPILSEEGKDIPYKDRKNWECFWLVDPLDGTKEFIKKNGEFTVNIALIFKDTPVLGVVFAPALNKCYWAKKDEGAFKDGEKLPLKIYNHHKTYRIVISRSHMSKDTKDYINSINIKKKKELISIGSSLKICLVAEGAADIYPRFGPTMEWDTGAAHAILNESGGQMYDQKKNHVLKYNKSEKLLNNYFVVENKKK